MKSVGLYYIAGVLLFLVYREQNESRTSAQQTRKHSSAYTGFIVATLLGLVVAIAALLRQKFKIAELMHFLVAQRHAGDIPDRSRMVRSATLSPFKPGAVSGAVSNGHPVPWRRDGSRSVLFNSILQGTCIVGLLSRCVRPAFQESVRCFLFCDPPELELLLFPCILAVIVDIGFRKRGRERAINTAVVSLVGLFLLIASFRHQVAYGVLWQTISGNDPGGDGYRRGCFATITKTRCCRQGSRFSNGS